MKFSVGDTAVVTSNEATVKAEMGEHHYERGQKVTIIEAYSEDESKAGEVYYCDGGAGDTWWVKADDLVGEKLWDLMHPDVAEENPYSWGKDAEQALREGLSQTDSLTEGPAKTGVDLIDAIEAWALPYLVSRAVEAVWEGDLHAARNFLSRQIDRDN